MELFGKYWILILCLVSCTRPVGKNDNIGRGVFEGGKYSNQYFGLEVTVPPQWHVFTWQDNKDIKDRGAKDVASRVDADEQSLERLKSKITMLLTISKEGPNVSSADNSSFSSFAEDVEDHRSGIHDGHAYLSALIDSLIRANSPIVPVSEIEKTTISGREFFFLTCQRNIGSTVISQRYYARYERGYILAFVVTSTHIDNDMDIKHIIEKIRLTNQKIEPPKRGSS